MLGSAAQVQAYAIDMTQEELQPVYKEIASRYHLPIALLAAVDRYCELNKDASDAMKSSTFR